MAQHGAAAAPNWTLYCLALILRQLARFGRLPEYTHGTFTYPDGRTEEITASAGTVQHMDAFTHLPESLSNEPFEVIAVELKR